MRFVTLLAVLFLSGCSLFSKEEAVAFSCPKVGFVTDASRVMLPTANAAIDGFSGDCSFKSDSVGVTIILLFTAKREEAGATEKGVDLSYFIAILSPEEEILQRRAFSTHIDFDNTGVGNSSEEHELKIPLPSGAEAYKYKVAIGFNKEKK